MPTQEEARARAGEILQVLVEDLEAWALKLADLMEKGKILRSAVPTAQVSESFRWRLCIETQSFFNRPDVQYLGLRDLLAHASRFADVQKVFFYAGSALTLLPDSPTSTKRLQLVGLEFNVDMLGSVETVFSNNRSINTLRLLKFGPANLPRISDEKSPSLRDDSYVSYIYDSFYPPIERYEKLQEIYRVRARDAKNSLDSLNEKYASIVQLSMHGHATDHVLKWFEY